MMVDIVHRLHLYRKQCSAPLAVKRSRCTFEGCNALPTHCVEGSTKPTFCAKHALEGMVYPPGPRVGAPVTLPGFTSEVDI